MISDGWCDIEWLRDCEECGGKLCHKTYHPSFERNDDLHRSDCLRCGSDPNKSREYRAQEAARQSRLEAIGKMTDQGALLEIAMKAVDSDFRKAAIELLSSTMLRIMGKVMRANSSASP